MSVKKVAINGFGRIGKMALRSIIYNMDHLEVVAVNGKSVEAVCQYLKYDSIQGRFAYPVRIEGDYLIITKPNKEFKILVTSLKNPLELPWKNLEVDVVLECTGVFRDYQGASQHLQAGAKKVIISAPSKSPEIPTVVIGVNNSTLESNKDFQILSNASCTTNCVAPIIKVISDNFEIVNLSGITVHAYTASQLLVDGYDDDSPRGGRAAALNIIPETTGAAKAVEIVLPKLKGKLSLASMRVPVATGSVVYLTINLQNSTTPEEVNKLFKTASETYLQNILEFSDEYLVSSDIVGNPHSAILDSKLTKTNGKTLELTIWYDNEWGYSNRLVELAGMV